MEDVISKINELNLGNDVNKELFKEFITTCESNIYEGKNSDGETIVVGVQKDVGIQVSTYQSNGWIRINSYDYDVDEEGSFDIIMSETYEKD